MATTQGIKLDEQTRQRLKALAVKKDRSPHWLMRAAIDSYLEKEEQYEREKAEDMQRWDVYVSTGQVVANSDLSVWLDKLAAGKNEPWQS